MENNNILSEKTLFSYDQKKIDNFSNELHSLFHIYKGINDNLETDYSSLPEKNKKRFLELVKLWNSKYNNIALQVDSHFKLKIFFNIHLDNIKQIIKKMIEFSKMEVSEDDMTITVYFDQNNTLTLERSNNYTQLIYLEEDMLDLTSPEFRICTILGLSSYNTKIDLKKLFQDFSFSSSKDTVNWYNINRGYSTR